MPLIQVNMLEGRTPEQKKALLGAITQAVHDTLGSPLPSIRVWIHEFSHADYMIAGVMASERDRQPATAQGAPPDNLTTDRDPSAGRAAPPS